MLISSPNTCTLPSPSLCFFTPVYASFGRVSRNRIRRHRRSNKLKHSSPTTFTTTTTTYFEPKLETVIDLTHLQLFRSNIRQFIWSSKDAYHDLQNLFTLDDNRKLVISCRPSTLHFIGTSTVVTLVVFSVLRVLVLLISRFGYWRRNSSTYNRPMVRRDRSLGGKEVVVAMGPNRNTPVKATVQRSSKNKVLFAKKLPKWWPTIVNSNDTLYEVDVDEQEEYKREAYRVVRGLSFFLLSFYFS